MRGAGGTEGGIGRFFIGLTMLIGGAYLFLDSIRVTHQFSMGYSLYRVGNFDLTSGMVLIPFIFGIGMVFYNSRNPIGWLLCGGALVMFLFGMIASIRFRMEEMTAFSLIVILVLLIGGLGLFFSSLRNFSVDES